MHQRYESDKRFHLGGTRTRELVASICTRIPLDHQGKSRQVGGPYLELLISAFFFALVASIVVTFLLYEHILNKLHPN